MKRILIAIVLMFISFSALADAEWDPDWGCSADGSGCGGESLFQSEGTSTGGTKNYEYSLGTKYDSCVADGLKVTCKGCAENRYGAIKCSGVFYPDACYCEQKQKPGAAPGITYCEPYGSCTYG